MSFTVLSLTLYLPINTKWSHTQYQFCSNCCRIYIACVTICIHSSLVSKRINNSNAITANKIVVILNSFLLVVKRKVKEEEEVRNKKVKKEEEVRNKKVKEEEVRNKENSKEEWLTSKNVNKRSILFDWVIPWRNEKKKTNWQRWWPEVGVHVVVLVVCKPEYYCRIAEGYTESTLIHRGVRQ